jgi:hypothetical protein
MRSYVTSNMKHRTAANLLCRCCCCCPNHLSSYLFSTYFSVHEAFFLLASRLLRGVWLRAVPSSSSTAPLPSSLELGESQHAEVLCNASCNLKLFCFYSSSSILFLSSVFLSILPMTLVSPLLHLSPLHRPLPLTYFSRLSSIFLSSILFLSSLPAQPLSPCVWTSDFIASLKNPLFRLLRVLEDLYPVSLHEPVLFDKVPCLPILLVNLLQFEQIAQ